MTENPDGSAERGARLLPWIAAERAVRGVLLLLVGLVLVTHTNTDYGRDISRLAQHLGFDPASNGIRRLSGAAERLTPAKIRFYGVVAIAYGLLEGVESYGLFHRRRWAEYLTVVATVLLFVPEIDELVKKPSLLKVGAILVNLVIVIYLTVRLRRTRGGRASEPAPDADPEAQPSPGA
jgi:uncharacterized membrane protein (DUF2068 family)